ncbi:hypothetical protein SD70_27245 [Gordoniibacillus kamchatkensis]|uniref:Calcineurin-like phosphoesterase domain-containing protein n=1 Tax=Gordoniibacillus kamchatkensis TaxID=1590651 RepID=A0ABR5ABB3_9BACL|nr:metallophosphoesterase [Paenibacillus sp. VKM B-2647]KIL38314.1 hypothetical protein SD70_27245 [Paenibacillus sp. VKM B-2647]
MNWPDQDYAALLDIIKEYPNATYPELASLLTERCGRPFTGEAVRMKLQRMKIKRSQIIYENRKNEKEHNVEELLDVVVKMQKKFQEMDDRQTSITLSIDDSRPIGIAFTGDWHTGGIQTDHEQMKKDFALIRDTDGLFCITMGDYNDNYITRSHPGGSFEQVITADKQKTLSEYFFTEFLANKILAVIEGNHDHWEVKETGENWVKYIARKIEKPFLWYGGEINLRFGNVAYRIHARHTFKYNSSLNTTNSQRNLFAATHADIIALGHLHYNEVHNKRVGGIDTVWMRTGSYKITDDYSQWLGGFNADERVPMVILWPDRKKILPFRSIYDGIKHLRMVRSEHEEAIGL